MSDMESRAAARSRPYLYAAIVTGALAFLLLWAFLALVLGALGEALQQSELEGGHAYLEDAHGRVTERRIRAMASPFWRDRGVM